MSNEIMLRANQSSFKNYLTFHEQKKNFKRRNLSFLRLHAILFLHLEGSRSASTGFFHLIFKRKMLRI